MSTVHPLPPHDQLTRAEADQLVTYEQVIATGLQTFVTVGTALLAIREGRLYRQSHPTFEAYCQARWGMVPQHANRLIAASEVVRNLEPIGSIPASESQIRPLTRLAPHDQQAVWQEAVATAPNGKVTAAHVAAVVEQLRAPPLPNPDAAREIARRDGRVVLDNTGHWRGGSTEEEVTSRLAYHALLKAIQVLAQPPGPPAMLVTMTPDYWRDEVLYGLPSIVTYLMTYHEALRHAPVGDAHAEAPAVLRACRPPSHGGTLRQSQ